MVVEEVYSYNKSPGWRWVGEAWGEGVGGWIPKQVLKVGAS